MSNTPKNQSVPIEILIEQIVKNETTIFDAINALKKQLRFMNEEALYNMIIDLLKCNKHLPLIDNYKNDLNDIDNINEETENIMKSFEPNELIQLRTSLMTDNNKHNHIKTHENQSFVMDWMKVCECVSHEMWPKLSSIIKSIIREKK
eukprot:73109_1